MATYRLIEINDKLIADGKPFWRVEKWHWLGFWTEHFGINSESGCTFFKKEEAESCYNYYANPESNREIKVLAQTESKKFKKI